MTPEILGTIGLILFMAVFLVITAAAVYYDRKQAPVKLADHTHGGLVRSQHEVAGQLVKVYECAQCGLHFSASGEKPSMTTDDLGALHSHMDRLSSQLSEGVAGLRQDTALRFATEAYINSHTKKEIHTVNGFEQIVETLCQCPECKAARTALMG